MRHWSILLAATTIMVLGFVASLIIFGDQTRLQALLIGHVEVQTGRHLSIDGEVSLQFFPRFRIRADQIRLSGPSDRSGPDFISADSLSVELRLLPLLLGRVETRDLALEGVRLNFADDESGSRSLAGLIRRPGSGGGPGITASGPVRLEDAEIGLAGLTLEGARNVRVDRIELDQFSFDQAINLNFQGGITQPVGLTDVEVGGVLFVPSESEQFQLSDMRFAGRHAPAGKRFLLSGGMSFSRMPPQHATLDRGILSVNGQRLLVQGYYDRRARPFFSFSAQAETLDVVAFSEILSPGTPVHWPIWSANWVAQFDFELGLTVDRLTLGPLAVPNVDMTAIASNGVGRFHLAPTSLPGALLSVDGQIATSTTDAEITGQLRLDVDDLARLLNSVGSPLVATGAGQIRLVPDRPYVADVVAAGELDFFDGRFPALAELRELAGLEAIAEFDTLQGEVQILTDAVAFPSLHVRHDGVDILLQVVWLPAVDLLQGTVFVDDGRAMQRFELGGSAGSPRFRATPDPALAQ